jgi:hypothetical protein
MPIHLVVHALIGMQSQTLHKGAIRTYTNDGTQFHEHSTRVAFGAPPGNKPKNLSQSQLGVVKNNHQHLPTHLCCSKPSMIYPAQVGLAEAQ